MNLLPLILAKRAGAALDESQIRDFVEAVSRGEAPDYQISALLMAIFCRGMDRAETVTLTEAMAASGQQHAWDDLDLPTVDKHSTGGVGDKLSLIIAPLAAELGVAVPMLSGRGLGFTGGTLDKLESIPGFETRLTRERFRDQVARLGCAFVGQSDGIAPADRKLYSLRDVTGTVESLPLIVSSILSKKLAAGPAGLVIDLKVGRGAFMKEMASARELGAALRETAVSFGRRCSVLYTRMEVPLGRAVGNAPEVLESLEVLAGGGEAALRELALALTVEMLGLALPDRDRGDLLADCERALEEGRALRRFAEIAAAQGGQLQPEADGFGLPVAAHRRTVEAGAGGFMPLPDAEDVGRLCVRLGAGRARAEDAVDPAAGLRFLKGWGEPVAAGEPIVRVEGGDAARVERAATELTGMMEPSAEPRRPEALLMALEDAAGHREIGSVAELVSQP